MISIVSRFDSVSNEHHIKKTRKSEVYIYKHFIHYCDVIDFYALLV